MNLSSREKPLGSRGKRIRRLWRGLLGRTTLLLIMVFATMPAMAWNQLGHAVIGDLADQQLTLAVRAQVNELLTGEPSPTLGGVASWADALRDADPGRGRATSAWHYINSQSGRCDFDVKRDCADGNCIVEAILSQQRILADRSQPVAARREALKFLVHFIGDVHQPFHASNRPDAGGNQFQVSLRTRLEPPDYARSSYRDGVMGTNLHTVWDYYVLASARMTRQQYVAYLSARALRGPARPAAATPLAWAKESCALIDAEKLYPAAHVMDDKYLDAKQPLAERRLTAAATRLAAVINQALGSRASR